MGSTLDLQILTAVANAERFEWRKYDYTPIFYKDEYLRPYTTYAVLHAKTMSKNRFKLLRTLLTYFRELKEKISVLEVSETEFYLCAKNLVRRIPKTVHLRNTTESELALIAYILEQYFLTPVSPQELAEIFECDREEIERHLFKYKSVLGIRRRDFEATVKAHIKYITKKLLAKRVIRIKNFREIVEKSMEKLEHIREKTSAKSPRTIASLLLYLTLRENGAPINMKEYCKIACISSTNMYKHLREFQTD